GPDGRALHDRSKSVPLIPNDILAHVQTFREQQLKKGQKENNERAPMLKSFSQGAEPSPPLPPNHPTAGKSELHEITQALRHNRKLSQPNLTETDQVHLPNSAQWGQAKPNAATSSTLLRGGKTTGNTAKPVSSRQRDPAQDDVAFIQMESVPESETSPTPSDDLGSKRSSFSQGEPSSAVDELAAITAMVTKQPFALKKGPQVAPKPSPGGAVSKVVEPAGAGADTKQKPSTMKAPLHNIATESFKKRLGNLMTGSTTSLPTPMAGGTVVPPQGNSSAGAAYPATSDLYEDISHYQNAREISATTRNL
ncbi:hypothetical protein EGW08_014413, partial [Elysia chlorotica]